MSSQSGLNWFSVSVLCAGLVAALCAPVAGGESLPSVQVRPYNGRPTVFVGDTPVALPSYSPISWSKGAFERQMPGFYPHRMGVYFIMPPRPGGNGYWATQFWKGDTVSDTPLADAGPGQLESLDAMAQAIIANDPNAYIMIRFGIDPPSDWLAAHRDELFIPEDATAARTEYLNTPSFASDAYWGKAAEFCAALVRHVEGRPWANRVLGYANFYACEGCHLPLIDGWLIDHNPRMQEAFRAHLVAKYGTLEALRAAYRDEKATPESIALPREVLRASTPEASRSLYWQAGPAHQAFRDYMECRQALFHKRLIQVTQATRGAAGRDVLIMYDAIKQTMMGWNNPGFFNKGVSWNPYFPDLYLGTGSSGTAPLFQTPGFSGLITPHDYQARGIGGVYEPEGIVDTCVLRGKYFFCEMDTRTWGEKNNSIGRARNLREFEAITWRNFAASFTRGFTSYWMDLYSNWFLAPEMQPVIQRQVEVIRESINWPHETMPGIAMILDDTCYMETNGNGSYLNEAVMLEWKAGLARCGVPFRIYLFEDLALDNFPEHRVYYFPNLFRADEQRMALLREKVFRNGHVVVWGPGSGISDGQKIGAASASALTGFQFEMIPENAQRRILISNFDHPVTRTLAADTLIGSGLPYGPVLYPTDGTELGLAWAKGGANHIGLAFKSFGAGATGASAKAATRGAGDYAAVFTSAVPLPANLWRELARYAGAHVYLEENEIIMADSSVVAIHSIKSGRKSIALPGRFTVVDVVTGETVARRTTSISFDLTAPETRVFRLVR